MDDTVGVQSASRTPITELGTLADDMAKTLRAFTHQAPKPILEPNMHPRHPRSLHLRKKETESPHVYADQRGLLASLQAQHETFAGVLSAIAKHQYHLVT